MAVTPGPFIPIPSFYPELRWLRCLSLLLAVATLIPLPQSFSQAAPRSVPKAAPKTPAKPQTPAKSQKKVTEEERLQQLYDSARTFQLSGDSERASAAYTAFLTEALRSMARADVRMGQTEQAEKLLNDILAIAPNDVDSLEDYAQLRFEQGKLPEARVLAEKAP